MKTPVLIAGMPGKMAAEVAGLVAEADDLKLHDVGITGPVSDGEVLTFAGQSVRLVAEDSLPSLALPADTIAVDYTTPDAALGNVGWYTRQGVPFVMGTTGYDMDEAKRLVAESEVSAVIAPNMGTPIVLLQAAGRWLAEQFPRAMQGSDLTIRESHQATKRDTSGTAKAMVDYFQGLGVPYEVDQIEQVRDADRQRDELAIPAEHLAGHAFHRYELSAAAGTVQLVLEHNVVGRRVYAEGTLQAVRFLRDRIAEGSRGEVFSMEDVLRG